RGRSNEVRVGATSRGRRPRRDERRLGGQKPRHLLQELRSLDSVSIAYFRDQQLEVAVDLAEIWIGQFGLDFSKFRDQDLPAVVYEAGTEHCLHPRRIVEARALPWRP